MRTPREIAQLAQMACIWEVCAAKPGNVTRERDFADSSMTDYLLSAIAIGSACENSVHLSVGEIILQAVEDTHRLVHSNTNLGIVLLFAPLTKACCAAPDFNSVRQTLSADLEKLSVEDARLAYAAIRTAHPGGMGTVAEADISGEPSISLLQAMVLARDRDSIAREYATGFGITFEIGLPAMNAAIAAGAVFSRAIVQAYLVILSRIPDTLIIRKKGAEDARRVSAMAEEVIRRGGIFTSAGEAAIREMDQSLRDPGHTLNPGTTADLTAAAIFLSLLESHHSDTLRSRIFSD